MVLILSTFGDLSTDWVIDWLNYYHYPFYRINAYDVFLKKTWIDISNSQIVLENDCLKISDINVVWYRKFGLLRNSEAFKNAIKVVPFDSMVHVYKEWSAFLKTISNIFDSKRWLTRPDAVRLNKCSILRLAKKVGLHIPQTHVVNNKNAIEQLLMKQPLIFKSIYDPFFPKYEDKMYSMYTQEISETLVKECDLPELFSPSLIQEKIDKEYEIRVFYLNKRLYSMCIFSQNDTQTQLDFRNYNWEKPNRRVPYKLPHLIEKKIRKLMHKVGLNCGSLDLIKSKNGLYYFLEINPVGQFGMVELPCNYDLHRKVAVELIKMDRKRLNRKICGISV
ncbi:MAG: grasp-with-spasm system ATP-grasp peptide maturase [Prevotellaceae bacterium]|jgi:ATP-GRASP peptide maturase of grasp-with-spasm system|nr:grasp-with-spasm system ATP-grasp peptide maturase [Prevotellaceae bacterium]